jgi:hypothetical protein
MLQARSQPVSYQQPYRYYPPVPAPPSEENAKSKIFTSFRMRGISDKYISHHWPIVLVILQVMMIIFTLIGLMMLLIDLDLYLIDPYQLPQISSLAILFIVIAFLIQVFLMILEAYLTYRTVQRRDEHFRRDWLFRDGTIEYVNALSQSQKIDLNVERWTMNTIHESSNLEERERSPMLWALLIGLLSFIPFIGYILMQYVLHFLTKEQRLHEDRQLGFNHQLQKALVRFDKTAQIPVTWQPMPRRNTALYMVLSLLTLGFFIPYWWYVVITDMNAHVARQWQFEDGLVRQLQKEE